MYDSTLILLQMDVQHWFHCICSVKYNWSEVDFTSPNVSELNTSQNQKTWVFFSSPARAHTEHMLATRFWRHRADDEIAYTAIIFIDSIVITNTMPLQPQIFYKHRICRKSNSNSDASAYALSNIIVRISGLPSQTLWKLKVPNKKQGFGSPFLQRHVLTTSNWRWNWSRQLLLLLLLLLHH